MCLILGGIAGDLLAGMQLAKVTPIPQRQHGCRDWRTHRRSMENNWDEDAGIQ